MNLDPVQVLIEEHRVIQRVIDAWGMIEQSIERGASFPADLIETILDFIHHYADEYHHFKEEDLFVPYVEGAGSERARGAVGLVRQEHKMARYRARRITELLPQAASGDAEARAEILRLLHSYCSLITCHIGMEDMVFFPNGYAAMTPQTRNRVIRDFAEFDARPDQQGIREKYLAIAEQIVSAAREMHNGVQHSVQS